jgi:lipoprotein signal peptidase
MIFAEIKKGVIVNVSVWEQDPHLPNFVNITGIANVGIGWAYVDGQFVEPTPAPEPIEEQE